MQIPTKILKIGLGHGGDGGGVGGVDGGGLIIDPYKIWNIENYPG